MNNWLYSDERMELRSKCLTILFNHYGGVRIDEASYSTEDIYSAAHDWVSQGNPTTQGLQQYFEDRFVK